MRKKVIALIIFFVGLIFNSTAQDNFFGLVAGYNGAVGDPGLEARVEHKRSQNWSLVPHFSYYPGIRNINELYVGSNVNYYPFEGQKLKQKSHLMPYLLVGLAYNRWFNSNPRSSSSLGSNNIVPQSGMGLAFGGFFFQGFAEFNYHIMADEGTAKIGFLMNFKNRKLKKKTNCP